MVGFTWIGFNMKDYAKNNVLQSLDNAITYTSYDEDRERRDKVATLIEAFKARIARIYNGGDSPYSEHMMQDLCDAMAGNTSFDEFRCKYASGGCEMDYSDLTIRFGDCEENMVNVITVL